MKSIETGDASDGAGDASTNDTSETAPPTARAWPILERRRLEAMLLKHVYETVEARSGRDEARAVVGEAVSRSAIEHGRSFAAELDGPATLKDFRAILPLWTKGDALSIDVLAEGDDRLDFDVTRCRYAEMYREMGLAEIGDLLSCNRDGDFCIGFNPAMTLRRTQTIMRGATHCDFRYTLARED